MLYIYILIHIILHLVICNQIRWTPVIRQGHFIITHVGLLVYLRCFAPQDESYWLFLYTITSRRRFSHILWDWRTILYRHSCPLFLVILWLFLYYSHDVDICGYEWNLLTTAGRMTFAATHIHVPLSDKVHSPPLTFSFCATIRLKYYIIIIKIWFYFILFYTNDTN